MRATKVRILPRPPGFDLRGRNFGARRRWQRGSAKNVTAPQDNRGRDVRKRYKTRRVSRLEMVRREVGFFGGSGSAWVAQLVERVLGKDEVTGSIPVPGSSYFAVGRKKLVGWAGVTQR